MSTDMDSIEVKEGDLIRVLFDPDRKSRPFWQGKLAVVLSTYGYHVNAQRIIGGRFGVGFTKEVMDRDFVVLSEDDLNDHECAALARWRLSQ